MKIKLLLFQLTKSVCIKKIQPNFHKMLKHEIKIIVADILLLKKHKNVKRFYFIWLKVRELKQRKYIYIFFSFGDSTYWAVEFIHTFFM